VGDLKAKCAVQSRGKRIRKPCLRDRTFAEVLHWLGKPFVYVGMTGLDPDLRFDKHKAGIQANRFVFSYGLRLLPAIYAVYSPMPYQAARKMEVELAIGLREAGYGVW
jgi:hypothetical protein